MRGAVGALEAARAILEARAEGRPVAVVARCDEGGDGARLIVAGDGAVRGSLGAPALDAAAIRLARELLADPGAPPRAVAAAELLADGDAPRDAALYAEAHHPPGRLFIVGAGHIALPLARLGVMLGFPVLVLDDREDFATADRFGDASDVRRVDFADPFADVAPAAADSVVLVTRAHRYDFDCLRRLLDRRPGPRYIGMVGSRRRVRAALRALLDAGVPAERLAAIHAPVGVDIGAETPEEIALSIAAELVAIRRGATPGGSLRDRERVVERFLTDEIQGARDP